MPERSPGWLAALLIGSGAWLLLAPFWIRSYGVVGATAADWNSNVVGLIVFVLGWMVLLRPKRWQAWASLILGSWLIIAPFVLSISSVAGAATSNHMLVGCLLVILGFVSLAYRRRRAAAD